MMQGTPFEKYVPDIKKSRMLQRTGRFRIGSMLLKKSLSTADQNFSRPLMRFSDKNVRDLVS
jgi:hypothetical protein